VNPQQIEAQAQGSVAMGLTAALYGEMTLDKGRMQELNFHNYQILRLAEMPKVEVLVAPTGDFWGGVGEPTICVVSPAVMNAIYAATGKPVRSLPIKNQKLV
jgi:isoquinoline 1-oxidoreductase beta subunit